jgi:hypothetical protein
LADRLQGFSIYEDYGIGIFSEERKKYLILLQKNI